MFSNESQSVVGDVIEHEDGSRYVVLPNGSLAYLGNRVLSRSEGLLERSGRPCRILGRTSLMPYVRNGLEEMDDIEHDWDRLRQRERIPLQLPKGCTCGHDALVAVSTCEVHEVRLTPTIEPDSIAARAQSIHVLRTTELRLQEGVVLTRTSDGRWPRLSSGQLVDDHLIDNLIQHGAVFVTSIRDRP